MMNATYSAEDNKLRLYSMSRLGKEMYERVRAAGFRWAAKQELFVAPGWTPAREDLLLELCGEIDDEDYSPTERSADRADRFAGYRDKRASEAGVSADAFDAGPTAFGHQSRDRAERLAARHDRKRTFAVSQWSKAEYWQTRTEGVISHALYKSSAKVRRSRILRLEAEQRKHESDRQQYAARFAAWSAVTALEGSNRPGRYINTAVYCGFDPATVTPALRAAWALVCDGRGSFGTYTHLRTGRTGSLYDLMIDLHDPVTPAEAAALWLNGKPDPELYGKRWSDHYANRLTYERAMLAAEGGTAADADMEPGGWIGKHQIHGVNRSPKTGKVVSVKVMAPSGWHGDGPLKLKSFNIQRLPEGSYRAPTSEEREAFKIATEEAKAEKKATTPKAPSLINPTEADAQRLQDLWNKQAAERHRQARGYGESKPTAIVRMTQKRYSEISKGSYARAETVEVCADGRRKSRTTPAAFKIRKTYGSCDFSYQADAVIVITDKTQKPLPLDWETIETGSAEAATAGA